MVQRRIFISGARGFIGRRLLATLARERPECYVLGSGTGAQAPPLGPNQEYVQLDIRSAQQDEVLRQARIDTVVHLASVVTPPPGMRRQEMHDIDVGGTRRLLDASLSAGVGHFIVTTSGAAYGYHADNAPALSEEAPLRGNPEFAYSDHKRQVEDLLADYRVRHPQLRQLVFRPGTILGDGVRNQITALFEKPVVLGVAGAASPFVIIWDEDVAAAILRGIDAQSAGIYNMAGDGSISLAEIAGLLGKPFLPLPAGLIGGVLGLLRMLGLSQYGPELVNLLRYRPVLDNTALKEDFGYTPALSSRDCFLRYARGRGLLAGDA